MISFLQFVFVKISSLLRSLLTSVISQVHSIFKFFNHKNFFRPIWSVNICKNIFIFWYCNNITNFKFRIFTLTSLLESKNVFDLISTGFILIVLWYVLLYLLTISSNLSIYIFLILKSRIYKFCFLRLQWIFQWQQIFFDYALNTFPYHYSAKIISLIYCKIHCLLLSIFYLVCGLPVKVFLKSISNCNFLSFKGITHAIFAININNT